MILQDFEARLDSLQQNFLINPFYSTTRDSFGPSGIELYELWRVSEIRHLKHLVAEVLLSF